jgi:hypothetical protein
MELVKKEIVFFEDFNFTGTENYYKTTFLKNFLVTDGIKFMFEKLACYWVGDVVASYFPNIVKLDWFFSVKVIVNDSKAFFTIDDGNENVLIKQDIPFTDLKHNLKMFLQWDGEKMVLMLPSEY